MPAPLAGAVRVPADQHHDDAREEIGHGGEEADRERIEAEGLDHLRHPEADAVEPDHDAEIEQRENEDARLDERLPETGIADLPRLLRFNGETGGESLALALREPCRVGRPGPSGT